jgi:hypothetical protein
MVKHVRSPVQSIHQQFKCTSECDVLFEMVVHIMCSMNSVKGIIHKIYTYVACDMAETKLSRFGQEDSMLPAT